MWDIISRSADSSVSKMLDNSRSFEKVCPVLLIADAMSAITYSYANGSPVEIGRGLAAVSSESGAQKPLSVGIRREGVRFFDRIRNEPEDVCMDVHFLE